MKKLYLLTFLILSVPAQPALAQESDNPVLFAKYCSPDKNAASGSAKIIIVEGIPKLKCIDSKPNERTYFEQTNIDLKRSSDEKVDPAFFASEEWGKVINSAMIQGYAKAKIIDPNICKSVEKKTDGAYFIKCDDGRELDASEKYQIYKKIFETAYTAGAKSYSDDKDKTNLKELYTTKLSQEKTKTQEVISTTTPTVFFIDPPWENLLSKNIVIFNDKDLKQDVWRKYMWETPPSLINDANKNKDLTWKNYSNYQPILIQDQSLLSPVKFDEKFKIIPLPVNQDGSIATKPQVTITPAIDTKVDETKVAHTDVDNELPIEDKVDEKKDTDCADELNKEIAALLDDDKKNIIGLQFELTVLKMAAATSGANANTFEGLIKSQSKNIAAIDTGIITKMNKMYSDHGLKEDAEAITKHLNDKASKSNYYAKDKRFFNQDSSAFVLAYQNLVPDSGIKDADVAVLWFMDKVSAKAKSQGGAYTAKHNLTNLSTRIAQYTGAIDPKKAISKQALDEMVTKQTGKLDAEFSALIQDFKKNNIGCYESLFGKGDDAECKSMDFVTAAFTELLAVNSKIESTDLISLDAQLKGGLDKTRFSIAKYVDSPAGAAKQEVKEVIVDESDTDKNVVVDKTVTPQNVVPVKTDDEGDLVNLDIKIDQNATTVTGPDDDEPID